MRRCTVCIHPAREQIDRALISEVSYRSVAKRFDISELATFRHRQHLPATLVKAREVQEVVEANSLVQEVQALAAKARDLTAKAEAAGDLRTALMGLREIARVLELRARVAGEIAGAQVNINIATLPIEQLSDDEADELRRRLTERHWSRHLSPAEQARIQASIEDAILTSALLDPEKRKHLRARLAALPGPRR
jgi:predicted RNA-binding Zn ribbon-like protein